MATIIVLNFFIVQGLYSQHFIFYVSHSWAQEARVLRYTGLKRYARDKHSSLLGPIVFYVENEVFWIQWVVVLEVVNGKKVEAPKFCRFPVSESGRPRCRQGFIAFFLSLECWSCLLGPVLLNFLRQYILPCHNKLECLPLSVTSTVI
jgi:hypothetical protein